MSVFLALGANIEPRRGNIESAVAMIRELPGTNVVRVSSLLENPSVGGPADAPDFLNAAAELQTSLQPEQLLDHLLRIESSLGRVRGQKNAPRPIDLDLLLFDDRVMESPRLKLPHPRMHERLFVLRPLAEIAPHAVHPVQRLTISQLLQRLVHAPDAQHC